LTAGVSTAVSEAHAGLPARDVYGIRVARSELEYMHDRVVMVAGDKMLRLLLP
jgi:hypothetical protein